MELFLYRISQDVNNGYDTYDSAIVVAKSEEEARKIYPNIGYISNKKYDFNYFGDWADTPSQVTVEKIGTATGLQDGEVVCSSFNAG